MSNTRIVLLQMSFGTYAAYLACKSSVHARRPPAAAATGPEMPMMDKHRLQLQQSHAAGIPRLL